MVSIQTLKGFRDFLPRDARKREFVLNTLKKVFALYGFEPLETPSLEYEEILTGKYGAESEKIMYKFIDNGGRKVALRYDQTVPLARVAAEYLNDLPIPFKRYQIQNVWRAENTQRGRYREFLQVDVDTVGVYSPLADTEILLLTYEAFKKLGLNINFQINDRSLLKKITSDSLSSLDKLNKIGEDGVLTELVQKGKSELEAKRILNEVKSFQKSEQLIEIEKIFEEISGVKDVIKFEPTLVRGLDYYTGLIFEVTLKNSEYALSLGGGGRYDNLIGIFAGRDIPAVGFSFGFDRLIEVMEELNLFPKNIRMNDVFVAFSNSDLQEKALEITNILRNKNINAEVYLEDASLEKQLKYADKKGIPYCIIVEENNLIFKDMEKRTQEKLSLEVIIKSLKKPL